MVKAEATEFRGLAMSSSLTSVHFVPQLIVFLLRNAISYVLQWHDSGLYILFVTTPLGSINLIIL